MNSKCKFCSKTIAKNHRYIQCQTCLGKAHIKCNETDSVTFNKIKAENLPQFCLTCKPNTKKCGICNKNIAANHKKLKCKNCHLFVHIKCNETDIKTYDKINHDKMSTICISCQPNNIPFMGLNDLDFIDINNNSPILTHKIHCSICTKTIAKNHKIINCNSCNSYVHIKCKSDIFL